MRLLLPVFLTILLASCFHKDVMNDRADDVVNSFIYKGKEGTFIITKEQVFQANSKESNGGITSISGYAEYRITSYDLETGKQVGRMKMGEGIEKAFTILGATEGKIWIYSLDPDYGFHCRNPKTMEVIADEKTLLASGALKGFSFAKPEWNKLDGFYGWNAQNGKLMLTDMQGFHYYYDPNADSTSLKTEDAIPNYTWAKAYLNSSGYFTKEIYLSLNNDVRKKLLYQYEDSTGKFSYLQGQFIIDNNPLRDIDRKKIILDSLFSHEVALNTSLKKITDAYPELMDYLTPTSDFTPPNNLRMNHDEYDAFDRGQKLCTEIKSIRQEQKKLRESNSSILDNALLSDDKGYFYVLHAENVSDTARAIITKLQLTGKNFSEVWTTTLPTIYSDPDKARAKGAFETVFSSGNPSFGYKWFDIADGKLVMIEQLRMICLDVKTGKILWDNPL